MQIIYKNVYKCRNTIKNKFFGGISMIYNKKGISLIALIITIIVITILAAVMIPNGVDKIDSAKLASFNSDIMTLKQEIDNYMIINGLDYPVKKDTNGNYIVYSISNNPTLMDETTKKNDNNDTFYIVDLQKLEFDNLDQGVGATIDDYYIVTKNSRNVYYSKGIKIGNIVYHTKRNKSDGIVAVIPTSAAIPTPTPVPANSPKLSVGMIPIRFTGVDNNYVDLTATEQLNANHEWYDYRNTGTTANQWANVRLKDGSMLVWIPRYTYKIEPDPSLVTTDRSIAGNIDVKFSNGTEDDTSEGYRVHPAFYWGGWDIPANATMTKQAGGVEIKGIWVGKFEVSAVNGLQDTSGDKVVIKPNLVSWKSLKIGAMFDRCCQMQDLYSSDYGIDTNRSTVDAHMLKNSEWVAAAYLSKYARGTNEVEINDNVSFIGGKGDYALFTGLSTTGTVYGIYDMSGCSWEYLSSYIKNTNANLNGNGSSIVNADAKYKDVLPVAGTDNQPNNYNLTDKAYGHALWETSAAGTGSTGWFADSSYFMQLTIPFVSRGGNHTGGTNAGVFYFYGRTGDVSTYGSWRVSVVVP